MQQDQSFADCHDNTKFWCSEVMGGVRIFAYPKRLSDLGGCAKSGGQSLSSRSHGQKSFPKLSTDCPCESQLFSCVCRARPLITLMQLSCMQRRAVRHMRMQENKRNKETGVRGASINHN